MVGPVASPALLTGRVAAQEEFDLKVPDRNLVLDIMNGKKLLRDAGGNIPPETQKSIDAVANYAMMRITLEVNRGLKPGVAMKMPDLIRQAGDYVLEIQPPPKKVSESQKDFIQVFGKACVERLRTILGTPEKPSKYEMLVRVNATRLLALLAKSGYEETADVAVEIIENPKESDGVRFYCFQALKNLFSAYNPDFPEKSVVSKPARELKAVLALIHYITRTPPLTAETPADELDALRYVRREAIRRLGHDAPTDLPR